ncbi:hypothetical protein C8R47DRAFT_1231529 [Mycena vitilis]|nr:hypothetical protein C8R47DRAFT_1231529 [Mycena vitilis]
MTTRTRTRTNPRVQPRVLLLVPYHDGVLPASTSTDLQSEFADLPFLVDGPQSTTGSPACGAALGSMPLTPILFLGLRNHTLTRLHFTSGQHIHYSRCSSTLIWGEYRDRGQARESRACTARSASEGMQRVEQLPKDAQDVHGLGEEGRYHNRMTDDREAGMGLRWLGGIPMGYCNAMWVLPNDQDVRVSAGPNTSLRDGVAGGLQILGWPGLVKALMGEIFYELSNMVPQGRCPPEAASFRSFPQELNPLSKGSEAVNTIGVGHPKYWSEAEMKYMSAASRRVEDKTRAICIRIITDKCDRAASTGTGILKSADPATITARTYGVSGVSISRLRLEEELRDPPLYFPFARQRLGTPRDSATYNYRIRVRSVEHVATCPYLSLSQSVLWESSVTEGSPLPSSSLRQAQSWIDKPREPTSDVLGALRGGVTKVDTLGTCVNLAGLEHENLGSAERSELLENEGPSDFNQSSLPPAEYQRHTALSFSRIPVHSRGSKAPLPPRPRRASPEKKALAPLRQLPSEREIQKAELGSTQKGAASVKIRRHPTSPATFGSAFAAFSFSRRAQPTTVTSTTSLPTNAPKAVFVSPGRSSEEALRRNSAESSRTIEEALRRNQPDPSLPRDLTPPAQSEITEWMHPSVSPTLSDRMEQAPANQPRSRTGSLFSPPLPETTTAPFSDGLQQAVAGNSSQVPASQIPAYGPHIASLPDEELDTLPTRTEYLYEEFKNSSQETPLAYRCGEIIVQSLTQFDFLDLGTDIGAEAKRFRLRQTVVASTLEVMELLQITLDEMSKLVGTRRIYQVDPKGVIRDALTKGRDTIKEMMWAHHFLKSRLDGGVRTVDKLYLRDTGYSPASPASSSSSLWSGFDVLSPNSRLKGFMTNPAVLRSIPDDADSKKVEEAFAEPPEKGTARFWNRLTGKMSVVGASSYGLGEDWEPPANHFQGRSERRTRSGGGLNEVRFQTSSASPKGNTSYSFQEASTTPLASSQHHLPSTTPARTQSTGFQATSTPFAPTGGRAATYDESFSFLRQTPPHMERTSNAPPAAAAGGEPSNYGQNSSFQVGAEVDARNEWTTGNRTHNAGDASLIQFLDQGDIPVKDIGVPVHNVLPPPSRRRDSLPPWSTGDVNLGLAAQAPLARFQAQIPEGQPLPGGGIAPPPPPNPPGGGSSSGGNSPGGPPRQPFGGLPGFPNGGGGAPGGGFSAPGAGGPPFPNPPGPPGGGGGFPAPGAGGPPFPNPPGPPGGGGGFPAGPPGGGGNGDMRFRGRGREHEKPQDFIQARLLLLRVLLTVPPGSAEEVREVMRTAPITWKTLLNLNNIPDTPTLIRMVGDRQQELIVAAAQRTAGIYAGVSKEYIDSALARLQGEIRGGSAPRPRPFVRRDANAHLVEAEEKDLVDFEGGAEEPDIAAEAFVNEVRKQRPPPAGGYPYPRDDGNRTRLQKPPPSPCKHCGSALHWDRECRHHMTAMVSEKSGEDVLCRE